MSQTRHLFEPIRPVPPITTIFMAYPPLSMTAAPQSSQGACQFLQRSVEPRANGNIRRSALVPCSEWTPSALHCQRTDELYVMPLFQPFPSLQQGVSEGSVRRIER